MKWLFTTFSVLTLMICGSIGFSFMKDELSPELDLGTWSQTVETSFQGKRNVRYVDSKICFTTNRLGAISLADGSDVKVSLLNSFSDQDSSVYRCLVLKPEDQPALGGGGSRKALLKVKKNGDLELLESRSASHDFPVAFNEESKQNAVHWKFSKINPY